MLTSTARFPVAEEWDGAEAAQTVTVRRDGLHVRESGARRSSLRAHAHELSNVGSEPHHSAVITLSHIILWQQMDIPLHEKHISRIIGATPTPAEAPPPIGPRSAAPSPTVHHKSPTKPKSGHRKPAVSVSISLACVLSSNA